MSSSNMQSYAWVKTADVATEKGDHYIQRLCYHFSRKVTAEWEQNQGVVTFAMGICEMNAMVVDNQAILRFQCGAGNEADLLAITDTIDRHLDGFSKSALQAQWF